MEELLRIARALGDESRVRALVVLKSGRLCLGEIAIVLGLAPSTTSRHMAILEKAGLVEARRDGKQRVYRLPPLTGFGAPRRALVWAFSTLRGEQTLGEYAMRAGYVRSGLTPPRKTAPEAR